MSTGFKFEHFNYSDHLLFLYFFTFFLLSKICMVSNIDGGLIQVLEETIEWEDVEWSQTGVWIAGKEYPLARVHFLAPN